jgi:hypothetical protein
MEVVAALANLIARARLRQVHPCWSSSDASLAMKANGSSTMCVVPSRYNESVRPRYPMTRLSESARQGHGQSPKSNGIFAVLAGHLLQCKAAHRPARVAQQGTP